MIYVLSCDTVNNGGGIYLYGVNNGVLEQRAYFPCDRPMYAVKSENGLCVILRQPFDNSDYSGYFFIDSNLKTASEIKSTKGVVACHLLVDNGNVYTANYLSGSVVKNDEIIEQRKGSSVNAKRQEMPHVHFVTSTPDNALAVCDLGTDAICFYDKDLNFISEEKVSLGCGVRHLVFSNDNKYIYAINELITSIAVLSYKNNHAKLIKTINLQVKNPLANGAAIRLSENGKFLYVSLREENVILTFSVNGEDLELIQTIDCGGNGPRDFNFVDNKLICCNQKSNSVTVFKVNGNMILEKEQEFSLKAPLCVL